MREQHAEVERRAATAEDEARGLEAKMLATQGAHQKAVEQLLQRDEVARGFCSRGL